MLLWQENTQSQVEEQGGENGKAILKTYTFNLKKQSMIHKEKMLKMGIE